MTAAQKSASLREALYHFSLAKEVPDAELLDEYIRRYPEHAAALTAFAIDAVVDAACADAETDETVSTTTVSPAVSRAMSRFQNKLFAIDKAEAVRPPAPPVVANPFADRDGATLRSLARAIRGNAVFVMKLRDREIDPETMTPGFQSRVANEMRVPVELLVAHLNAPPTMTPNQMYKADKKPEMRPRQTFEEALRSSGLSAEDQEYLRNL